MGETYLMWKKLFDDEETEWELMDRIYINTIYGHLEDRESLISRGVSIEEFFDNNQDPYMENEYLCNFFYWDFIDRLYEENGLNSQKYRDLIELKKERAKTIWDGYNPGPVQNWKKNKPLENKDDGIPIIFDFVPSKKPTYKKPNCQPIQKEDFWEEEELRQQQLLEEEMMLEEMEQQRLEQERREQEEQERWLERAAFIAEEERREEEELAETIRLMNRYN